MKKLGILLLTMFALSACSNPSGTTKSSTTTTTTQPAPSKPDYSGKEVKDMTREEQDAWFEDVQKELNDNIQYAKDLLQKNELRDGRRKNPTTDYCQRNPDDWYCTEH